MSSLLETAAALAITGSVMMLVSGSLAGVLRVHAACGELENELFRSRQLEHLAERAATSAGGGPAMPAAISAVADDAVVFGADLDGDGSVDPDSSETSALEVRHVSGQARVRIKLGRQAMTVYEAAGGTAGLEAFGPDGASAGAADATLVALTIRDSDRPDEVSHRLLLSLPARTMR